MPRLILLNGPPGLGKSTLARKYVDEHPLALNLDLDRLRSLLGRWPEHAEQAGRLTRAAALAMAREHLGSGHDVVVPQYLGRLPFIEQLEQVASQLAADWHEIALLDHKENSLRRFEQRTTALGTVDPAHLEAADLLSRAGGREELARMYDRLIAVLAGRPQTKIVRTEDGQIERAYRAFVQQLT